MQSIGIFYVNFILIASASQYGTALVVFLANVRRLAEKLSKVPDIQV